MGYFDFLIIGLVLATLWRVQQLQGAVSVVKAQNDYIIRALNEKMADSKSAPDNEGEETL